MTLHSILCLRTDEQSVIQEQLRGRSGWRR